MKLTLSLIFVLALASIYYNAHFFAHCVINDLKDTQKNKFSQSNSKIDEKNTRDIPNEISYERNEEKRNLRRKRSILLNDYEKINFVDSMEDNVNNQKFEGENKDTTQDSSENIKKNKLDEIHSENNSNTLYNENADIIADNEELNNLSVGNNEESDNKNLLHNIHVNTNSEHDIGDVNNEHGKNIADVANDYTESKKYPFNESVETNGKIKQEYNNNYDLKDGSYTNESSDIEGVHTNNFSTNENYHTSEAIPSEGENGYYNNGGNVNESDLNESFLTPYVTQPTNMDENYDTSEAIPSQGENGYDNEGNDNGSIINENFPTPYVTHPTNMDENYNTSEAIPSQGENGYDNEGNENGSIVNENSNITNSSELSSSTDEYNHNESHGEDEIHIYDCYNSQSNEKDKLIVGKCTNNEGANTDTSNNNDINKYKQNGRKLCITLPSLPKNSINIIIHLPINIGYLQEKILHSE